MVYEGFIDTLARNPFEYDTKKITLFSVCLVAEDDQNVEIWFGLVWFYATSNLVGYLIPNQCLYIYIKTVLFQTIQFSKSKVFCLHTVKLKTVLCQTIQFSISTHFSSIWPKDRNLSGTPTTSQSGPMSDGNEEVLPIP